MPRFSRYRSSIKRRLKYKRRFQRRFQRRRTNMRSVAKKVYALSKYVKERAQNWEYKAGTTTNMSAYVSSITITAPVGWSPMFDAPALAAVTKDSIRVNNVRMRCRVTLGNEQENIDSWIFLVRVKDIGSQIVQASGVLGPLTAGTHYDVGSASDCFMPTLNQKYFTVVKKKYCGTGTWSTAGTNPSTGTNFKRDMDWFWNVKRPFVQPVVVNPTGASWATLPCHRDPSRNLFVLYFTNNSALDNEYPTFTIALKWAVTETD